MADAVGIVMYSRRSEVSSRKGYKGSSNADPGITLYMEWVPSENETLACKLKGGLKRNL